MKKSRIAPSDFLEETRLSSRNSEPHPESLLQIPLVRRAFQDTRFRLVCRGIDKTWSYQRGIPVTLTGFNPFQGAYYFAEKSFFAEWLRNPFGSARNHNENDFLVAEVLFMAHDYLHAWTYQVLDSFLSDVDLFDVEITRENFQYHCFVHLFSEAVATVGLDYWLLSVQDVNSFCELGTLKGPLTVSYREEHLDEYRRFCPDLEVQCPGFLKDIATFYCTGRFQGFDSDDLKRSPRLLLWLRHELKYGTTQRKLTRSWLRFLAEDDISIADSEISEPLELGGEMLQLIDQVTPLLWKLIKEDTDSSGHWRQSDVAYTGAKKKTPDFRFLNYNKYRHLNGDRVGEFDSQESFDYFFYQCLSTIHYSEVPKDRHRYIELVKRERDPALARIFFEEFPRFSAHPDEPLELFLPN